MITIISLHIIAEENKDLAMEMFKENNKLSKNAKGLISRYVFISKSNPLKAYSVTSWETEEDMEAWRKNPNRPACEYEGVEKAIYGQGPTGRVLLFTKTDVDVYEPVYSSYL